MTSITPFLSLAVPTRKQLSICSKQVTPSCYSRIGSIPCGRVVSTSAEKLMDEGCWYSPVRRRRKYEELGRKGSRLGIRQMVGQGKVICLRLCRRCFLSSSLLLLLLLLFNPPLSLAMRKGIESENAYVMKGKELERKKHEVLSMKVPTKVSKFKLKFEVTRDFDILEEQKFHFYCGSWVYPITKTEFKRIFFSDQLYLPKKTPQGLVELRKKELQKLQAPRPKGEWNLWDRIYDYDVYNNLGDPKNGRLYDRPVLGGSTTFPYPRRLKTCHPNCQHEIDHSRESEASCFQFYVPPDERMSDEKLQELKNNFVEALIRFLAPKSTLPHLWDRECPDFVTRVAHFFVPKAAISKKDVRFIRSIIDFCRKLKLPSSHGGPSRSDPSEEQDIFEDIIGFYADKEVEELDNSDKQRLEKLVPKEILNQVVATLALKRHDVSAQLPSIIAGGKHELIAAIDVFSIYHEDKFAWAEDKEFGRQMLAGTNPVRIRMCKWQVMEEDVSLLREILEKMWEYDSESPKDGVLKTLHINALARAIFLNAGGILETLLFTGEYSMELSSHLYKEWRFDKQALPEDLLERGMAKPGVRDEVVSGPMEHVESDKSRNKAATGAEQKKFEVDAEVELFLEDYPYAKDGIEIWTAIETWVTEYCNVFYLNDNDVKEDEEIQEWWNEIKTRGHKDRTEGWYNINTFESLVKALTTLIWITSGLHAAVNFGQYGYGGWPPNRPMLLRKFLPRDEKEMEDMDIMKFMEEMLPDKFQMKLAIAVMDLLSRHTSDEVYLGQTSPQKEPPLIEDHDFIIQKKFKEFRENLKAIERNIKERNKEYLLMNRWGDAKIPYKLLYPDTSKSMPPTSKEKRKHHPEKEDINERGISNSISI
ncbi:hypothetical protein ES288_D08G063000v1 [Gossypium darwinii]|uniref:Lipoxygenase domain-containing protein n=1 Tax=Gossypium darwinii TaxID=34276 RepID=A0A5D2BGB8_GOSDA|nr:hypothetical protein ES288_D08G063000v1 [Gossypium darwinii]